MYKILLTLFITTMLVAATAQEPIDYLPQSTSAIGVAANGDSIFAEYIDVAPYKLVHYEYLQNDSIVYLHLKKPIRSFYEKGEYILRYNLLLKKVIWSCWFPENASNTFVIGDVVFRNEVVRERLVANVYDARTGKKIFKTTPFIVESKRHRLLFNYKGKAISTYTFKRQWDVPFNSNYGATLYSSGGDTLTIIAEGLMRVDIKTGKYWYHQTSTGLPKYGDMIAANAVSYAKSIFTGINIMQVSPDRVYGMHSKLMVTDDGYYYSGREEIFHTARNGNLLWKKTLPENMTGTSKIWFDDEHVYLLNSGIALRFRRAFKVSKPYIACYNKVDGKLIYHKQLEIDEITTWSANRGAAAVLSNSTLYSFNTVDGSIANSIVLDNLTESPTIYNAKEVYTRIEGGEWAPMTEGWIVIDKSGKIITLSNSLQIITNPEAEYSMRVDYMGEYEVLMGKKNVMFLKDGKLVAEVKKYADPRSVDGSKCMAMLKEGLLLYTLPE